MRTTILVVESNRELQRELDTQIRQRFSNLEPVIYVRKAADIPQITEIVISAANLAVNVIQLALAIRDRQSEQLKSKLIIELQDGHRTLKIDAVAPQADIDHIIHAFFSQHDEGLDV